MINYVFEDYSTMKSEMVNLIKNISSDLGMPNDSIVENETKISIPYISIYFTIVDETLLTGDLAHKVKITISIVEKNNLQIETALAKARLIKYAILNTYRYNFEGIYEQTAFEYPEIKYIDNFRLTVEASAWFGV